MIFPYSVLATSKKIQAGLSPSKLATAVKQAALAAVFVSSSLGFQIGLWSGFPEILGLPDPRNITSDC